MRLRLETDQKLIYHLRIHIWVTTICSIKYVVELLEELSLLSVIAFFISIVSIVILLSILSILIFSLLFKLLKSFFVAIRVGYGCLLLLRVSTHHLRGEVRLHGILRREIRNRLGHRHGRHLHRFRHSWELRWSLGSILLIALEPFHLPLLHQFVCSLLLLNIFLLLLLIHELGCRIGRIIYLLGYEGLLWRSTRNLGSLSNRLLLGLDWNLSLILFWFLFLCSIHWLLLCLLLCFFFRLNYFLLLLLNLSLLFYFRLLSDLFFWLFEFRLLGRFLLFSHTCKHIIVTIDATYISYRR